MIDEISLFEERVGKPSREDLYMATFSLGELSIEINKEVAVFIMDELRKGGGHADESKLLDLVSLSLVELMKIYRGTGLSSEDILDRIRKVVSH